MPIKIFAAVILIFTTSGCAVLESAIGTSTYSLRNNPNKETKIIAKDISSCYEKTLQTIRRDLSASVYNSGKDRFIVAMEFNNVFKSCIDTTEVGIFFKKIEPDKTEVQVSSLNYHLAQFVAQKLFEHLEK